MKKIILLIGIITISLFIIGCELTQEEIDRCQDQCKVLENNAGVMCWNITNNECSKYMDILMIANKPK